MSAPLYPAPAVAGVVAVPGRDVAAGMVLFLDGESGAGREIVSVWHGLGVVIVRRAGEVGPSLALNGVDRVWVVAA